MRSAVGSFVDATTIGAPALSSIFQAPSAAAATAMGSTLSSRVTAVSSLAANEPMAVRELPTLIARRVGTSRV
jgi:hypothetical protein